MAKPSLPLYLAGAAVAVYFLTQLGKKKNGREATFAGDWDPAAVPKVPKAELDAFVERVSDDKAYRKKKSGPLGGSFGPALRGTVSAGQASMYTKQLKDEAGAVLRAGTQDILVAWVGQVAAATGIPEDDLMFRWRTYSREAFGSDWNEFKDTVGDEPLVYFALRYSAEVTAAERLYADLTT